MENQLPLFPNLPKDNIPKEFSEQDAKLEAAKHLETLLAQGFVNVEQEDISNEYLKNLITKLRAE